MGVCGCGKTTVGEALAQALGWPFLDADDFHPAANVAKMASRHTADRRRSLAVARSHRRRARGASSRAAATRSLACSALQGGVSRSGCSGQATCASCISRATRRRSPRGSPRASTSTCRRRCSRSSRRWKSPPTRSSSTSAQPIAAQVALHSRDAFARVSDDGTKAAGDAGRPSRPRAAQVMGAVNTPVFRASTILFETVAELERAARGEHPGLTYGLHGLPTVTDLQDGDRSARRRACGARRAVRAYGDDVAAARVPEARRPRARDRRRLRSDAALLRQPPAAPRRRRRATTIRCIGAGIARRITAEHAARVPRIAGLADVRGAGHSRDRRRRARARRARGPRQHVGDAARLPRVRPRRRRVACTRRPSTSAVIRTCCSARSSRTRPTYPAAAPPVDRHGRHRVDRRLLPRAARLAHARRAPRAPPGERAAHRAMAARRSRRCRRCCIRRLPGARGHELWKRDFQRRDVAVRRGAATGRRRARIDAMLDGMRSFRMGWSWGGFESLIIPTYPERSRTVTRGRGRPVPAPGDRPRGPGRPDRGPGEGSSGFCVTAFVRDQSYSSRFKVRPDRPPARARRRGPPPACRRR